MATQSGGSPRIATHSLLGIASRVVDDSYRIPPRMGERLHDLIAQRLSDTSRVPLVLADAGLAAARINLQGSANAVWLDTVREARNRESVMALVRAVEKHAGPAPELRAAARAEMGESRGVDTWMCTLDRVAWRREAADLQKPVTALVLTGPEHMGHRYVSHWSREHYETRMPPLEIVLPRGAPTGAANRLMKLLTGSARAFEMSAILRELANANSALVRESSFDTPRWAEFWARFVSELRAAVLPRDLAEAQTHALVRYEILAPRAEDAVVLVAWLRHVLNPLGEALGAAPDHESRCVVAFELHTTDAALVAALDDAMKSARTSFSHVAVAHPPPLGTVEAADIRDWLTTHKDLLLGALERFHPDLLVDGRNLNGLAQRIHERTDGYYEAILRLFRET